MLSFSAIWIARIAIFLAAVVTLLPHATSGQWFVRLCDAPRVQLLVLLIIPALCLAIPSIRNHSRIEYWTLLSTMFLVVIWQGWHIIPYTRLYPRQVAQADEQDDNLIRFMISNIEKTNENFEEIIQIIKKQNPDVLLIIEINASQLKSLQTLKDNFGYHCDVIRDEGLGLALWSKLPLKETQIRHLVSDRRASIFTKITSDSGQTFRFAGIHPTPPGLVDSTGDDRRNSRVRDAELAIVAREVSDSGSMPWVVTGDFNDVAWSHTTRLFARVSGLKDPRIGRKLLNTFHAKYPPLRFPIDQVYCSEGSLVNRFERVYMPGSDHFSVVVELSLPLKTDTSSDAQGDDLAETKEKIQQGEQDAKQRNVDAN